MTVVGLANLAARAEYLGAEDRGGAARSGEYLLEAAALHLALLAVPGVGTVKAAKLLRHREGIANVAGADDEVGARVRRNADAARGAVSRAVRLDIAVIPLEHPDYPPALLDNVGGPPPVLFVKGALPPSLSASAAQLRSCAIVGTRRASRYSLGLAESVGRVLAGNGILVVSGLAIGVDGAAHRGALDGAVSSGAPPHGLPTQPATVAVLGGGHAHLHPATHAGLADRIVAQGGALISEWPPDTPPAKHHFLRRNRIISALARCVLVVEAGASSGALSTASHAVSQARHLLVVPGRPDDPRYTGNLRLLREGAGVFLELADVLLAFGISEVLPEARGSRSRWRVPIPWSSPLPSIELGPLAEIVRSRLASEAESSLDSLLADLDGVATAGPGAAATTAELTALLIAMELAGEVEQTSGGRYRLRRLSAAEPASAAAPSSAADQRGRGGP